MKTVTLLFEKLSAASLGCYGSGFPTPGIDEFATTSDLFTSCFADRSCEQLDKWMSSKNLRRINTLDEWENLDFEHLILNNESQSQGLLFGGEIQPAEADGIVAKVLEALASCDSPPAVVLTAIQGGNYQNMQPENETTSGETSSDDTSANEPPAKKSSADGYTVGEIEAHVPLIVNLPQQEFSRRRMELTTTSKLPELISSLLESPEHYSSWRDQLVTGQIRYASEHERAVRTERWLLIQSREDKADDPDSMFLFRKPEDVWEILNVVDQYPQVIDNYIETGQLTYPED